MNAFAKISKFSLLLFTSILLTSYTPPTCQDNNNSPISLKVPKLTKESKTALDTPMARINNCNWSAKFPYSPEVDFSIAYDDDALYIRFRVAEDATMARVTEDNGEVWTDSCVEFFVSFDNTGYYNFEFTCIGKMLIGFRKDRTSAISASSEILNTITRESTLGSEPFDERFGDQNWELSVRIPLQAFFKHNIKSFAGLEGVKANFYKCGDKLSKPHYLSWAPISNESPNFHLPEYFGNLEFTE